MASCVLIYIVTVQREKKIDSYHRILLGLSVTDILHALAWIGGPLAVPRDTSLRTVTAMGNTVTCAVDGAMFQLGGASYMYSAVLSLHFMLVIRYGLKDRDLRRVEIPLHILIWVFSITTSVAGVYLKLFNEVDLNLGCWVSELPSSCGDDEDFGVITGGGINGGMNPTNESIPFFPTNNTTTTTNVSIFDRINSTNNLQVPSLSPSISSSSSSIATSSTPCMRGNNALLFAHVFAAIHVMMLPIVIVFHGLIYAKVRKTAKAVQRYNNQSLRVADRTKKVATQGFLFVLVYVNCTLWTIIIRTLDGWGIATANNEQSFLALIILSQTISPAQGLLNLLIYIRPRYMRVRERHEELSQWQVLWAALWKRQSAQANGLISFASSMQSMHSVVQRRYTFGSIGNNSIANSSVGNGSFRNLFSGNSSNNNNNRTGGRSSDITASLRSGALPSFRRLFFQEREPPDESSTRNPSNNTDSSNNTNSHSHPSYPRQHPQRQQQQHNQYQQDRFNGQVGGYRYPPTNNHLVMLSGNEDSGHHTSATLRLTTHSQESFPEGTDPLGGSNVGYDIPDVMVETVDEGNGGDERKYNDQENLSTLCSQYGEFDLDIDEYDDEEDGFDLPEIDFEEPIAHRRQQQQQEQQSLDRSNDRSIGGSLSRSLSLSLTRSISRSLQRWTGSQYDGSGELGIDDLRNEPDRGTHEQRTGNSSQNNARSAGHSSSVPEMFENEHSGVTVMLDIPEGMLERGLPRTQISFRSVSFHDQSRHQRSRHSL